MPYKDPAVRNARARARWAEQRTTRSQEFLEKRRSDNRAYYLAHREEILANEERKARLAAYRAEHQEESRAYFRARYLARREKHLEECRDRYQIQGEAIRARVALYNKMHREKRRAYAKRYQASRYEQIAAQKARYVAKHPDRIKAQKARYRKTHPYKAYEYKARRRAWKAAAVINDLTNRQWLEIQAAFDHCCAYCGKRAKGHLTQDHLTPLSKGGNHTVSNVVPACRSCNARKREHEAPRLVQPLLLTSC